ncbi:MAG: GAF domain-containing protein [Chlorobi bacterium]|nr:GAF domain-containing protein [Chlorobiota bacterium]
MDYDINKNINKTKQVRLYLIIVTTISFVLFGAYFLVTFYKKSLKSVEEKELLYLKGISQTLASAINGDAHEYIYNKYQTKNAIQKNEEDSIYLKLRNILHQAQIKNNLSTDIYTLVLDKDATYENLTNASYFVVTSSQPYFRHTYTPSAIFFDNYVTGGVIPPYTDDHGTWLSAFSPILNSDNEVVAAVQVDLQFDDYINKAKSTSIKTISIIGIFGFIIIVIIIILISSISSQLIKEQKLLANNFDTLNATYNKVTKFINKIAGGNLSEEYNVENESDLLGNSLIELRNSLIKAEEDNKIRRAIENKQNWSTKGLALFGDILRENTENIENLSFLIISNLVKHLEANQGGMYILSGDENLENENSESLFFEQTATYAYNRKKFTNKKIPFGEGLIGMVAKEKKTIFMTDIPDDYLKITSGLGKANPNSLLIVPLKINDEIFGIIEIASFKVFEKYQIDFVERIAESIATTLKTTKTKIKTEKLLDESREMTSQLQEQEEELRQNTEEMLATQEEMKLYQAKLNSRFDGMNKIAAFFELDGSFRFTAISDLAKNLMHTNKKLLNEPLNIFNRSKQNEMFYNGIFSSLKETGFWQGNILYGGSSSFQTKIAAVQNEVTNEISFIGILID